MALVLTRVSARILLVSMAFGLAGCASYAQRYAQANEEGLRAAGFTMRLAEMSSIARVIFFVDCTERMRRRKIRS